MPWLFGIALASPRAHAQSHAGTLAGTKLSMRGCRPQAPAPAAQAPKEAGARTAPACERESRRAGSKIANVLKEVGLEAEVISCVQSPHGHTAHIVCRPGGAGAGRRVGGGEERGRQSPGGGGGGEAGGDRKSVV
jgi:hypothetical protein